MLSMRRVAHSLQAIGGLATSLRHEENSLPPKDADAQSQQSEGSLQPIPARKWLQRVRWHPVPRKRPGPLPVSVYRRALEARAPPQIVEDARSDAGCV